MAPSSIHMDLFNVVLDISLNLAILIWVLVIPDSIWMSPDGKHTRAFGSIQTVPDGS